MTEHRAPYDTAPLDPDALGEILPPETQTALENARPRTHYDGCHRVHPECALAKVSELKSERDEAKRAAQAQSEYIQANGLTEFEMARLKAELDAAQARIAEFVSVANAIVDAGIYLTRRDTFKLFRCANAAKRQAKRELDAANERAAQFEDEIAQLQNLPYAHGNPTECPTWHDICNCNVETLKFNINRAAQAESDARAMAQALDVWDADGKKTPEQVDATLADALQKHGNKYLETANAEPKR